MSILASLAAVEPELVAGVFMTVSSILSVWLAHKFSQDERADQRREDERLRHYEDDDDT